MEILHYTTFSFFVICRLESGPSLLQQEESSDQRVDQRGRMETAPAVLRLSEFRDYSKKSQKIKECTVNFDDGIPRPLNKRRVRCPTKYSKCVITTVAFIVAHQPALTVAPSDRVNQRLQYIVLMSLVVQ